MKIFAGDGTEVFFDWQLRNKGQTGSNTTHTQLVGTAAEILTTLTILYVISNLTFIVNKFPNFVNIFGSCDVLKCINLFLEYEHHLEYWIHGIIFIYLLDYFSCQCSKLPPSLTESFTFVLCPASSSFWNHSTAEIIVQN